MTDIRDQLQQDLAGAYTFEHELTGGGMSRVFVARDNALGRQVAIKILLPEMAAAGPFFPSAVGIATYKRH